MPRWRSTYSASSAPSQNICRAWPRQTSGPSFVANSNPDARVTATRAHQVPAGARIGRRVRANPLNAKAAGAIDAGVALASGWPE